MSKPRSEASRLTGSDVVARARQRCANHLGLPRSFCSACFRTEVEEQLAAENPGLERGAIAKLVDDWILASGKPMH